MRPTGESGVHAEVQRRALIGGMGGLGDADLVALIAGPADGSPSLLGQAGGLRGLANASVGDLARIPGVGRRRALRVLAAVELGRRAAAIRADSEGPVRSSGQVHARLAPSLAPLDHEVFLVLGLDARGRVMGEHRVAEGGIDACSVTPREVFRPLLRGGAATCILAHNHPSGESLPSAQDRLLTVRMAEVGRIIGLRVLDHVIIASGGWYSFRDEGIL